MQKIICLKDNYWKDRLWTRGETVTLKNGENYPKHFHLVGKAAVEASTNVNETAPDEEVVRMAPVLSDAPFEGAWDDYSEARIKTMNKNDLEAYAKQFFGADLDKRHRPEMLVDQVLGLREFHSKKD